MSSSSAQLRKIKKPMIERRRRERINDSLNQLKNLVLEATNKDETRYSKMEKADILEMTVAYLRATHCRRRSGVDVASVGSFDRYAAGFRLCAVHVGQYLLDAGVSFGVVHERLMSHLDKALQAVVDVEGCARLPGAEFDVATEKVRCSEDCDTTGRCSSDTDDDDDCGSVSGAGTDVDDVIRWQCTGRGTTATAGVQPLTDTTTATSTTTTACRQPVQPGAEVDSPRGADEFPSFPPTTADTSATAADHYTTSAALSSLVVNDICNDHIVACDGKVIPRVTSTSSTSSPVISSDSVIDNSSDVWRPW